MCEKQKRIEELERENAEIYKMFSETQKNFAEIEKLREETRKNFFEADKLHSERLYNDIRHKWHTAQALALPLLLGIVGIIIAVVKT